MSRRKAEATAPCRVDLAGGPLDVWPLYLLHRGAVVVGVAVDRRVWCQAEIGVEGVHVESRDTLQKASVASVDELRGAGVLSLVAEILRALGVESAVRVVTRSPVPEGAGLGSLSALAVAVTAAVSAARGGPVDPDRLWPLVRDVVVRTQGRPVGARDFQPALHGGTVALFLQPGEVRVEALPVDPARVEECLLLIDSGAPGAPVSPDWEAVRGRIDGEEGVTEALAELVSLAGRTCEALVEGRFEDVVDLFAAEWEARRRLTRGASSPEIDRVVEVARSAGAAARPCGVGGGSVVAVWAPPGARGPGRREAAVEALNGAGFRVFPARVDLRGLEVA